MTILKKVKSHPEPVPFKIYADFESDLESVKSIKSSTQKISRSHSLCSLLFFICNIAQINHFVMYNNDSFEESQISF